MMTEFHVRVRYVNARGSVTDKIVRKYWYHSDAKLAVRNTKVCKPTVDYNYYIEEVLRSKT